MDMNEQVANLSPASRRDRILELLNARGECSAEELAERFGVSTMTIRRDLQELADAGRVIRTHGGATPASRITFEFKYLERSQLNHKAKEAIGRQAAEFVENGHAVMLDSGTTTLEIAHALRGRRGITVVTASLPIASALYGCQGIDLLLLGGFLRHESPDLEGRITEANVEMLQANVVFLGADGIDEQGNVYQASATVAGLVGRMTRPAGKVFAVADSSKLGKTALMRFGNLKDWDGLITDERIDPEFEGKLIKLGATVIKVAI